MSFILDALKKAEAERQRQTGPTLLEVRVTAPRRRLPVWILVLGALLGINVLLLAVFVVRRPPTAPNAAAPAIASAAPAIALAVPANSPAAPVSAAPAPAMATTAPTATAAPVASAAPMSTAAPMATAVVKFISKRMNVQETRYPMEEGRTAWNTICSQLAPLALSASITPMSISSNDSE